MKDLIMQYEYLIAWAKNVYLRIPDSYHAKTLKNHTPLVRYASYFYNQAIFKKFERRFLLSALKFKP